MATEAATSETLEVAAAFAGAYAEGNLEQVEALLSPHVRYREITPRRIVDQTGSAAIVDEAREFLAGYDRHETTDLDVHPVGVRAHARTHWRLYRGDETLVVEWCEYITVQDGLIVALDAVCSGPMPER